MMAALLQFRLKRLEAMRRAAMQLMNRPLLGRQVFARGAPEAVTVSRKALWEASLFDLLKAYAVQRERGIPNDYTPFERHVWSLQEAREILNRLIGDNMDWVPLDAYLAQYLDTPEERTTAIASTFASSLELVRLGQVELHQSLAFGPLLVRRRKTDGAPPSEN
jgi:segregation and condensation protein A